MINMEDGCEESISINNNEKYPDNTLVTNNRNQKSIFLIVLSSSSRDKWERLVILEFVCPA